MIGLPQHTITQIKEHFQGKYGVGPSVRLIQDDKSTRVEVSVKKTAHYQDQHVNCCDGHDSHFLRESLGFEEGSPFMSFEGKFYVPTGGGSLDDTNPTSYGTYTVTFK